MQESSSPVWVWDYDSDLLNRSGVGLTVDYNRCSLKTIDLWDASAINRPPEDKKIVYSTTDKRAEKLRMEYAFFPPDADSPVVDSHLRAVIESVCTSEQVGFHPCEIRTKSGRLIDAWNLYPLHHVQCIDRDRSDIVWKTYAAGPEQWELKEASKVAFKPTCLGNLHVARLAEDVSWVVVSDQLKTAIEAHNAKGIVFQKDVDSRIGNRLGLSSK